MEVDSANDQATVPANVNSNQSTVAHPEAGDVNTEASPPQPAPNAPGNVAPEEMDQQHNEENRPPISVEPPTGRFRAEGETMSFMLLNPSAQRYAIKVSLNLLGN